MIHFRATGRAAYARTDEPLTTGSVGIPVDVSLSSDFDGLQAVMVFRSGDVSADVALLGQDVVVPPQVLTGRVLTVGVYASSTDGNTVIPTVWCDVGLIRGSAATEFDPAEPTPGWSAQIQAWAEDAADSATQAASVADSIRADMDEFNETSAVVLDDVRAATTAANEGAANANGAAEAATSAKDAANVATENAIEATSAARTATTTANDAATLATSAAGTANTAATNADIATAAARQATAVASEVTTVASAVISAAQAATVDANSATAAAQQATSDAITATGNANIATAAASEATDAANSAANAANSAAAGANGAATYATTAATTANGAAATATNAAATADDATNRANAAIAAMGDISELAVPLMSADTRGGAKLGDGLAIADGALSLQVAQESTGAVKGPIAKLQAQGYATQDGTPTPDAPVDIVTATGHEIAGQSGRYVDIDVQGKNLLSDVASEWASKTYYIPVSQGEKLRYHRNATGTLGIAAFWVDADKANPVAIATLTNYQNYTFTNSGGYAYLRLTHTGTWDYATLFKSREAIIERGDTFTSYEPYLHEVISVPMPSKGYAAAIPYGTADILTIDGAGKYTWTNRIAITDLGTLNWANRYSGDTQKFEATISGMAPSGAWYTADKFMCTAYKPVRSDAISGAMEDNTIMQRGTYSNILVRDARFVESGSVSDFTAAVSGQKLLHIIVTPIIESGYVDLPDIPSDATITSPELDALDVQYFIGNEISTLAAQWHDRISYERTIATQDALASVAPIEHSPAESNHSVGELITYEGALYKVTAAIARGESITIGTNVAATTVAAELAALQ